HAGTARTSEPWRLALSAKPGANAADRLASPLSRGDALLDRRRHGAGELGFSLSQRVIACRHHGVELRFRFEVPQMAECADDPMTDLLDDGGDVHIGRWLTLDKPGLAACFRAIEIDTFQDEE